MILHRHRANIRLTEGEVLYLGKVAGVSACHGTVSAKGGAAKDGDSWRAAILMYYSGLEIGTFRAEMRR